MGARFHDSPPLQHVNPVGVEDGREPVGDEDGHGATGRRHVPDRFHDPFFGERIERRGRFVEDQQVRMPEQRTRDREPLLLAAGHLDAAFADDRIESLRCACQQAVTRRLPQHVEALVVGS